MFHQKKSVLMKKLPMVTVCSFILLTSTRIFASFTQVVVRSGDAMPRGNGRYQTLFRPIIIAITLSICLLACGGSNEEVIEIPPTTYDNSLKTFSAFEGKPVTLTSTLESTSYQWAQVSGPDIEIDSFNGNQINFVPPWISDGPITAEFTVTATIDGQSIVQPININILDRRYIVLKVRDSSATNLYLDYISANDEVGVPDPNLIQLTDITEGENVCNYSMSPNGRYVAFLTGETDLLPSESCVGLRVVDIESQQIQFITPLNRNNELVEVRNFSWSKDGLKLSYEGNHGEDIFQVYVAEVSEDSSNNPVSYINYGNLNISSEVWPSENRFPVSDGGNPFGLEMIDNIEVDQIRWLDNNNGLSFKVYDQIEGDYSPYIASDHGQAIKLERNRQVVEEIVEIDEDSINDQFDVCADSPPGFYCTIGGFGTLPLTAIERSFVNPEWFGSSVDGSLAFTTTMISSNTSPIKVLAVRQPIIEEDQIITASPIGATHVLDVMWSPIEPHLAFASTSGYRHVHQPVETYLEAQRLMQREIPDQLYYYKDWEYGHQAGQERLSRPRPEIDTNPVRKLKWSNDGQLIGYARGESPEEIGAYYTSLWINQLDEIDDESNSVIDSNTTLLHAVDEENTYYTDFNWSPNSDGILAMYQSDDGGTLKYFKSDGSFSFESPVLEAFNTGSLWSISASFSPAGDYFAYIDEDIQVSGESFAAIYIYDTESGERIKIETPGIGASSIIFSGIQWSPHGDAIIYSTRSSATASREFYLAKVDSTHENLKLFLNEADQILQVKTDNYIVDDFFLGLP